MFLCIFPEHFSSGLGDGEFLGEAEQHLQRAQEVKESSRLLCEMEEGLPVFLSWKVRELRRAWSWMWQKLPTPCWLHPLASEACEVAEVLDYSAVHGSCDHRTVHRSVSIQGSGEKQEHE